MACSGCGDKRIASEFKCSSCHVKDNTFLWCVITKASGDNPEENHYDELVRPSDASFGEMVHVKLPVFSVGDIFPVESDFEREMTSHRRKPGKWCVEYVTFKATDYQKAITRALKVMMQEDTRMDKLHAKYRRDRTRS